MGQSENGITIDSGSAAFVMPTKWLPGLKVEPSPGQRRSKTSIAATGTTAPNERQRTLKCLIDEGQGRSSTMHRAGVNTCLCSAGGVTDAGNLVIVGSKGEGWRRRRRCRFRSRITRRRPRSDAMGWCTGWTLGSGNVKLHHHPLPASKQVFRGWAGRRQCGRGAH